MRYYDLKKNWSHVQPHLTDEKLNAILVRDFNKFTFGMWGKAFKSGEFPHEYETCDWWVEHRGKKPEFWKYTKHAACHWIVNFTLRLATLVEPKRSWRIVTSQEHSTVWDGKATLFDFNFQAFGIKASEAFRLADEKRLPVGKRLRVYFAESTSS